MRTPSRSAGLRSAVGGSWLLLRRRSARNAALLTAWTALLTLATVLALAVPALVTSTIDQGARDAVTEAGRKADVLVQVGVGLDGLQYLTPEDALAFGQVVKDNLPPTLTRVTGDPTVSVLAQPVVINGTSVRFGILTDEDRLEVVSGALPAADDEVVVSAASGFAIGDVLDADEGLSFTVTGIVAPADAECWCDLPTLFEPTASRGPFEVTALATIDGVARVLPLSYEPADATIRLPLIAERFTSARLASAGVEMRAELAQSVQLGSDAGVIVNVISGYRDALEGFPLAARAAIAQMSLLTAGVLGVLATVIALLSRLIVGRRAQDLALERARGASLASIIVRSLGESIATSIVGVGLGLTVALLLFGPADPVPLIVLVVVAVLAGPVQSWLVARAASGSARQAANRSDRHEVEGRARVRRIVAELAAVALAAAAIVSVRTRGLLQTTTEGIDPLLAVAPLLLAVVVTIALLRIYPLVVRGVAALAARSRGAAGILGAAQAARSLAPLPVFALTLAMALAVGGGLLVDTVRSGQVDASWQRVGADARVDGAFEPSDVSRVASAPGVTAAGAAHIEGGVELGGINGLSLVTVIALDPGFAAVQAGLPDGVSGLQALESAGGDIAMFAAPSIAARIADGDEPTLRFGQNRVSVTLAGPISGGPVGYAGGTFVYVDLEALNAQLAEPLVADTLLVLGPGAADAVADLDGDVLTRAGWLAARQGSALSGGVTSVMALSSAAVGVLALLALLATVLATTRSRATTLSLLRTLGMRPRFGWWLAAAEIAPVVVAAAIGGALAGVTIVLALGPSLGLSLLAGGVGDPALVISPIVIVAVAATALALLVVSMFAEVLAHRRDRLSEVLRVGGTE